MRKTARALAALGQCCRALVQAHEESDLLSRVCRIIVNTAGYRLAWVGLAECNDQKSVRPVSQAGFEEGYLQTVNLTWADVDRGRGPTGTAIRNAAPCVIKDTLAAADFAPWREQALCRGFGSVVSLPLISSGAVLGASPFTLRNPASFDADEVALLQATCRQPGLWHDGLAHADCTAAGGRSAAANHIDIWRIASNCGPRNWLRSMRYRRN